MNRPHPLLSLGPSRLQQAQRPRLRGIAALRFVTLLLFAALLVAGCKPGSAVAEPPKTRFGTDICAECGMIVSEPRFAAGAAYEIEPGRFESLSFDDIGDLVFYVKEHQDRALGGAWVHDFYSEEWIDATTAHYVVTFDIHTPMGHGVAAFSDAAQAADLATSFGVEVLDWDYMRIEILLHNH